MSLKVQAVQGCFLKPQAPLKPCWVSFSKYVLKIPPDKGFVWGHVLKIPPARGHVLKILLGRGHVLKLPFFFYPQYNNPKAACALKRRGEEMFGVSIHLHSSIEFL